MGGGDGGSRDLSAYKHLLTCVFMLKVLRGKLCFFSLPRASSWDSVIKSSLLLSMEPLSSLRLIRSEGAIFISVDYCFVPQPLILISVMGYRALFFPLCPSRVSSHLFFQCVIRELYPVSAILH